MRKAAKATTSTTPVRRRSPRTTLVPAGAARAVANPGLTRDLNLTPDQASKHAREPAEGSVPQAEHPSRLATLAAEYLGAMAHERASSAHTLRAYRRELANFTGWLALRKPPSPGIALDQGPEAISHLHIRAWLGSLHAGGLSKVSAARALAAVRSWIKWMARRGLVEQNVGLLVATPKRGNRLPRVPTSEHMNGLIESVAGPRVRKRSKPLNAEGDAQPTSAWPSRDRVILELLYGCGIRNAELVGLDLKDLDWANGVLLIRGKGRKQRYVPMGSALADALERYLPERLALVPSSEHAAQALLLGLRPHPGTRLTTRSVGRILKQLAVGYGLPEETHPHTLRHAFGTHMLEEGADLRAIQELLGHERLSTTQRYTQLTVSHVTEVFDRTHPRAK